ncbi:hypothetical protein ACE1CI_05090 [Aerosakkonemataceae cyanobacterium BLCC-F50]|uniref:Sigma-70 family RNA polymerase sigma factor n=1 Tax=Floridaenema flaviceps BLCC-F50 TaxID=3153642 RepID=A0ABV4XKR7_9CYAN
MKKREDIVQKFSTFLSFGDYKSRRKSFWQADPQLERQIKHLTQSDPEAKEEFWAKYFLKTLREVSQTESSRAASISSLRFSVTPLPLPSPYETVTSSQSLKIPPLITARHLSAYLQEACLWAAQKSHLKYQFLRYKYPIEEYFQIAASFANLPDKLLKSFNLDHPRSNIEGYAKIAIFRFIRDKIYQYDVEAKSRKFSDYGLLKNLNAKELKEALASQGINQQKIDLYRLTWQCFDEIYQPQQECSTRNLQPPTQEDLKQIADYYNQRLNQLDLPKLAANEDKVQEILEICIKAARNYRTKQFLPLEEYDNISDPTPTPWDIAVYEEENQQVQLLVAKVFATIPEAGQVMLILWQGLDLTQSEIATVIKGKYPELQKQYQVARHLARYTKNILKDFVDEWNEANLGCAIDNERDLEAIKDALDECLQSHCKGLVNEILEQASQEMSNAEKLLIFNNTINLTQIATAVVPQKVLKVKESLTKAFISKLETKLNFEVDAVLPPAFLTN